MTNVLIVDDERITQELFAYYISQASDRYRLAGTIRGAANAELYCANGNVGLVLMDICRANGESGIEAAAAIKAFTGSMRESLDLRGINDAMSEAVLAQYPQDKVCRND